MAFQGQVIFWRYGTICTCLGRREGIAFFRLLGCITLLPGALERAVLCSLTVLHSLKLLKYQYSLFYTICKAMYVSDTQVQSSAEVKMEMHVLELCIC